MKFREHLVSILAVAALAPGCALHPVRNEGADVRASIDKLIAADNRGDLEMVLECYCDDAALFPPGREPVCGRKAIRASYTALFATWSPELEVTHVSTTVADGCGVDRGRTRGVLISNTGADTKRVDDEYEATLRREDGVWRVAKLAWRPTGSASGPLPTAPLPH